MTHSRANLVWFAANEPASCHMHSWLTPSTAAQQPLLGSESATLPLQACSAGRNACWHACSTSTMLLLTLPAPPLLPLALLLLALLLLEEVGAGLRMLVCTLRLASRLPEGSSTTTVTQAPAPTASAASLKASTYLFGGVAAGQGPVAGGERQPACPRHGIQQGPHCTASQPAARRKAAGNCPHHARPSWHRPTTQPTHLVTVAGACSSSACPSS